MISAMKTVKQCVQALYLLCRLWNLEDHELTAPSQRSRRHWIRIHQNLQHTTA